MNGVITEMKLSIYTLGITQEACRETLFHLLLPQAWLNL